MASGLAVDAEYPAPSSPSIAGVGVIASPDSLGAKFAGIGAPVTGIESWVVIGAAVPPAGEGVADSGEGAAVPTEAGAGVMSGESVAPSSKGAPVPPVSGACVMSGENVAPSDKGAAVPTIAGAWVMSGGSVAPSDEGAAVPTIAGAWVEAGTTVPSAASDGDGVRETGEVVVAITDGDGVVVATMDSTGGPSMPLQSSLSA